MSTATCRRARRRADRKRHAALKDALLALALYRLLYSDLGRVAPRLLGHGELLEAQEIAPGAERSIRRALAGAR